MFLIILKLRQLAEAGDVDIDVQTIGSETVQKLIETRVYLEKGVRPLEGRLKYQIEKVLGAAADEERRVNAQREKNLQGENGNITQDGRKAPVTEASETSDSETSSKDSKHKTSSHEAPPPPPIDDLSYRPNPAALLRRPDPRERTKSSSKARSIGAYKPPRITPTSMPDHPSSTITRSTTRHGKSHLLDEYIATELSSAPQAEPSIGSNSTILRRGRAALSAREREKEKERMEYEERNLSRLPSESKAERRKARARGRDGKGSDRFGGEDWTGLGEVGDRVARSVAKGSRAPGEPRGGVLERREKRRASSNHVSGDAGGGPGIGEIFEKRRKILEGRAERKRKAY